jgi:hypothetical protein
MSARLELTETTELQRWRLLFTAVGAYDLVLGFAFFWFYQPLFDALDVAEPETGAYVQLAAALVAVQGISYFVVARRPVRNVDLVVVGVVYKLAYVGLALYYWVIDELPHGVFLAFGLVDALVLVAFVAFLRRFQAELAG